jgi:hypothetical protein
MSLRRSCGNAVCVHCGVRNKTTLSKRRMYSVVYAFLRGRFRKVMYIVWYTCF